MNTLKRTPLICLFFLALVFLCSQPPAHAGERMLLTFIVASNHGNDFDLDNDAYRDKLMELMSYTSYKQIDQAVIDLNIGKKESLELPGGYDLNAELKSMDGDVYMVQVVVMKGVMRYVDSVMSIRKPGVVFMGGPPTDDGDLIIVLEMGF